MGTGDLRFEISDFKERSESDTEDRACRALFQSLPGGLIGMHETTGAEVTNTRSATAGAAALVRYMVNGTQRVPLGEWLTPDLWRGVLG